MMRLLQGLIFDVDGTMADTEDVQKVNISARRITDRFERIERVEMDSAADAPLEIPGSTQENAN